MEIHRVGDITIGTCNHGGECCPHDWVGIGVTGAATVRVNGSPAMRIGDISVNTCPHCGIDIIITGANTVNAEASPVARKGDISLAAAGTGICINGSPNVFAERGA